MVTSKPRICFVSQNIYPLLKENNQAHFMGGAELQQMLIGETLAARGYEVSFITKNHGQPDVTKINSFRVISTFKSNEGLRGVRFIHPRLTRIWQALKKTDADIYYVRCAGFILGPVVLFARLYGKKVIYCGANDPDFDPQRLRLPVSFRDKSMFFWGLRRCDAIVVQNRIQQRLLLDNFNRSGEIIHNGMSPTGCNPRLGKEILWVGMFKKQKNPRAFIGLAKMFPQEKFVMIGGSLGKRNGLETAVTADAERVPNLDYKGFLPFEEVEKRFRRARLLVNTSLHEGFPNTFLQAWRRGIPVISLVDPGNLIKRFRLGIVVKNTNELAKAVKDVLENRECFSSGEIKQYFDENLTIGSMVDSYEQLFSALGN